MNWLQRHWDARAAANFMLGGAGSGLMVAALLVADPSILIIISLILVASGLTAVWLEIGRKLRAVHVFFNPHQHVSSEFVFERGTVPPLQFY